MTRVEWILYKLTLLYIKARMFRIDCSKSKNHHRSIICLNLSMYNSCSKSSWNLFYSKSL